MLNDVKLASWNDIISDPVSVSNIFNDHFSTIAGKLADDIPVVDDNPLSYVDRLPNSFVYFDSDAREVDKIILSFKSKQSCLKSIPSFVFKFVSDVISPVLSSLINETFVNGTFQTVLRSQESYRFTSRDLKLMLKTTGLCRLFSS